MTDFFLRVERPEHRHTWRFFDTDAEGAEATVTVSIPKREWMAAETFDKTGKFVENNPESSINDLMLYIISLFDVEGHKWLKTNLKKVPLEALGVMWKEFQTADGASEGE